MSIQEKATCNCCDNIAQHIADHFDPSGDGIRGDSDAATVYAEIEEMFEGQDEGSGITVAHLEEYIAALETETEVEEGEESTMTLAKAMAAVVNAPEVTVEQLMNTPVQEPEGNVIDLSPTHAELIRAIQFADMLIEEATEKHHITIKGTNERLVEDAAKVVVTIQSKHKSGSCIAWFSDPAEGQPYGWSTREGEVYQEMNFTPEMLNHATGDIAATVIHEKVHKWCTALHVQDCSKGGRHNKKGFAKHAEYLGLVVDEPTDSKGYAHTSPSPELAERIEKELNLDVTKFNVYRLPARKGKPSDKLQKWVCTSDNNDCPAVYTRGEQELSGECHRCGEGFERAQPKGGDNGLISLLGI
jgi:hypothetical protein